MSCSGVVFVDICGPISSFWVWCGQVPGQLGEIPTDFPTTRGWSARQIILHATSGHQDIYQTCAYINLRRTINTQPLCPFVETREVVEEEVEDSEVEEVHSLLEVVSD